MKINSKQKIIKIILTTVISVMFVTAAFSLFSYLYTQNVGQNRLLNYEYGAELEKVDYVIVPGAGTIHEGPSEQQQAHLDRAIQIYAEGITDKILLSGGESEVYAMTNYIKSFDIPLSDIWIDTEGIDTYNTIKRATEHFEGESMYFCTLPQYAGRAGYIIDSLNIDGGVVNSNLIVYQRSFKSYAREYFAATKAFLEAGILKTDSDYSLTEKNITNISEENNGVDGNEEGAVRKDLINPAQLLNNVLKATSQLTFDHDVTTANYKAEAAVSYAKAYAESRNGNYPEFSNNCTNFISQCLVAGGMKMTGSPSFDENKYIEYDDSGDSWYCSSMKKDGDVPLVFAVSTSFLRTEDFVEYWTKQQNKELFVYDNTFEGRAQLRANTQKGDIFILYDNDEKISHIGIISSVSDKDALYCANTADRLDRSTSSLNDSVYPRFGIINL